MKKFMKGMFALVFALLLVCVVAPTDTFALDKVTEDGSAENPYTINNLTDLTTFLSEKDNYDGKLVVLTADITGASSVATKADFKGTFEGNNYSITGLTKPLFGKNNGIINNVILKNSNIILANDTKGLGGLVNENNGTINGCSNEGGSITSVADAKGIEKIGGIAGINKGTIINSFNTSNITITGKVDKGTIANDKGQFVGGIAGFEEGNSQILNCYNLGAISVPQDAGGVVGKVDKKDASVENSYNAGDVEATATKEPEKVHSGSLAGHVEKDNTNVSGYGIEGTNDLLIGNDKNSTTLVADEDEALKDLLLKLNTWVTLNNVEKPLYKYWYIIDKYPVFAPSTDVFTKTVTYDVVNGTWEDGTSKTITEKVYLYETVTVGEEEIEVYSQYGTGKLTMIPTGMKANKGYVNGKWDETPEEEVEGTESLAYTYSFDKEETGSTTPENPNTGDSPIPYMIIALLSLTGIIVSRKKLNVLN